MQMTLKYRLLFCLGGVWLASLLLSSCYPSQFVEVTDAVSSEALAVPVAEYRSVAWIDQDFFAFVYRREEFGDNAGDFRLGAYNSRTDTWQDLDLFSKPESCFPQPSHFSNLSRLPNGNLAFAFLCENQQGPSGTLHIWDRETNVVQVVQAYAKPFRISQYTFSPDMAELIQEEAVGSGLNNKLYRVHLGNDMEELFPNFQRARSPSWSPDGQTIAFVGTETYPGGSSKDFTEWRQIEGLLLYPWDLYLMNADGSNVRIILPKAGRPYLLKWAPQGKYLAFAGDSANDVPGIWILNTETVALVRVWPDNTYYDWSPDGQQMVIIAREGNGTERTYPVVINVPNLEQ
jgi:WD40 repeat protein